jgi:hypothetical protein
MNILQRALGLLSYAGGLLNNPELLMIVDRYKMIRKESQVLEPWGSHELINSLC